MYDKIKNTDFWLEWTCSLSHSRNVEKFQGASSRQLLNCSLPSQGLIIIRGVQNDERRLVFRAVLGLGRGLGATTILTRGSWFRRRGGPMNDDLGDLVPQVTNLYIGLRFLVHRLGEIFVHQNLTPDDQSNSQLKIKKTMLFILFSVKMQKMLKMEKNVSISPHLVCLKKFK